MYVLQGGTSKFKWRGWSNGGKNQNQKKSQGLLAKPNKIPGPNINPQNSHAEVPSLKNFHKALKGITSSTLFGWLYREK